MEEQAEWPRLMRRLPLILSAALGLLAVWCAYFTLSEGQSYRLGALFCSAIVVAGLVASEIVSGGLAIMPRKLLREVFGAIVLICALMILLAAQEMRFFPRSLRTWELVIGAVAAFAFVLHSQQSFLIHLFINSLLVFVALLNARERLSTGATFGAGAGMAALALAQMSVLFHRETIEEASGPGRALDRWLPVRIAPVPIGAATVLFAIFFMMHPSEGRSLSDVFREGLPATASKYTTGGGLDRAMPTDQVADPFNPLNAPATGSGGKSETMQLPWMSFERDLKFGDRGQGGGHPDTVILYVQVRDAGGATEGLELPLYWTTGLVTRYDGRAWTGDAAAGRTVEDGEDGERDGRVSFRLPPLRVPTVMLEQRTIVLPLMSRSLFLQYPVADVALDRVMLDSEGAVSRSIGNDGRFKTVSHARVPRVGPVDLQRAVARHSNAKYFDVPPSVAGDSVVTHLVNEVRRKSSTPYGAVQEVLKILGEFQYTLTPGFAEGKDATLECLRTRRGYCQHFASAMALLLRRLAVPTRIAVGFTRGDWIETDAIFVVRRKHAHSWVEAHFEGIGWVPFDPAGQSLTEFVAQANLPPVPSPVTPPVTPPKPPDTKPPDTKPPDTKPPDTKPPETKPPDTKPPVVPPPTPHNPANPGPSPTPPLPPPRTGGDPTLDPSGQKTEFERLWEAMQNRSAAPRTGLGNLQDAGGGGLDGSAASSRMGAAMGKIGAVLWVVARDLAIILVIAGAVYAIAVRMLRRRAGGKRTRGGAEIAEEWFVDEAAAAERERRLRSSIPRGSRRRRLVDLYVDLLEFLARLGFPRAPHQTPGEFVQIVGGRLVPVPAGLRTLTALFVEARYGEEEIEAGAVASAEAAHRETVNELKRRR